MRLVRRLDHGRAQSKSDPRVKGGWLFEGMYMHRVDRNRGGGNAPGAASPTHDFLSCTENYWNYVEFFMIGFSNFVKKCKLSSVGRPSVGEVVAPGVPTSEHEGLIGEQVRPLHLEPLRGLN